MLNEEVFFNPLFPLHLTCSLIRGIVYVGSCVYPESSSYAADFSEYAAFPWLDSLLTTDQFLMSGLSLIPICSMGGIKCIVWKEKRKRRLK